MQLGSIESSEYLDDLAYTLASRRTALDHRSFIISSSILDLSKQLQKPIPKLRRTAKNNNVFFIFTGQGAQWPTMGRDLIHYGAFNESLQASQLELNSLGWSWSLAEEMFAGVEESRIGMPTFSQPLCAALQIALVDLLRTWGIKPKAVVGHSSGEIGNNIRHHKYCQTLIISSCRLCCWRHHTSRCH
jgi:acyl transferase domain-containing protein